MIDKYEDEPGRPACDKQVVCYGQVQSYIYITLPAKPHLGINRNATAILALVKLCKTDGKDTSLGLVWYQEMENVRAFDVATIDCVIGRIKVGNRWGIIDRSYGSQRVEMQGMWQPEYESEDPND